MSYPEPQTESDNGGASMEMESKVRACFALFGFQEDPDEVTRIIGMAPSRTDRIGKPLSSVLNPSAYGSALPIAKVNSWELDSGLDTSADVASHMRALLDQLRPVWSVLHSLAERYQAVFTCIVESYGGDRPPIQFDKDVVRGIAELNAPLDVNLYILP